MTSENGLNDRLDYYGFQHSTAADLAAVGQDLTRCIDGALLAFYDKVAAVPELAHFFRDKGHMQKAAGLQRQHWLGVFRSGPDAAYQASAQRIGQVHARIGLEPRWYIGGYGLVLEGLIASMIEEHEKGRSRWGKSDGGKRLAADLGAVVKAALLDMDYSISIYLEVAETALSALGAVLVVAASTLIRRERGALGVG